MRYKITTLKNAIPYCYTLWANSQEEALYKAQQKDGIPPLLVEEFPLFSLSSNSSIFSIFSPPPSSKDVLTSLKQLHLMLSANLPIQQCIVSLARHTPNQKLAQIFSHLSHSLENGLSLYEGFLPYEKIFGKLTLVMIKFGSKSGRLCKCLALLLDELNDQENNKKEIKKSLVLSLLYFDLHNKLFCSFASNGCPPIYRALCTKQSLPPNLYKDSSSFARVGFQILDVCPLFSCDDLWISYFSNEAKRNTLSAHSVSLSQTSSHWENFFKLLFASIFFHPLYLASIRL